MAARRRNTDTGTRRMFKDDSRLFDDSYQAELEEQKNQPVECLGMTFANDKERRAYFTEKLREKLQDPEFRKLEGFPIGDNEDILALSDPPYYTACPNPFLSDFVKHYGKPYDPQLPYNREPFATDVSEGRSGTVYDAHTYHTKVPHKAIMRYVLHYTDPGDLVLDGFAGTGMTAVAASLCEAPETELESPQGQPGARRAIVADICPAATFIAAGYATTVPAATFKKAANNLLDGVREDLGWVYTTKNDRGEPETIIYTVWSDVFICPECTGDIVFWDAAFDPEAVGLRDTFECPHCSVALQKRALKRKRDTVYDKALARSVSIGRQVAVLVSVKGLHGRYERQPNRHDSKLLQRLAAHNSTYSYPTNRMMNATGNEACWGDKWRSGTSSFQHVHELYTHRNLIVLAALYDRARQQPDPALRLALLFLISSYNLAHCNKMARVIFKKGSKKPVLTGYQSGTLYVSSLSVEKNVIHGLESAKMSGIGALLAMPTSGGLVTTQSATDLRNVPANTVDYIFTDPPFGDNLAYAELNFISEAWLRVYTGTQSEAIVSKFQHKDLLAYAHLITRAFSEYRRVLKPGRWMTVEFHNTRNAVWNAIQEGLLRAGFVVADVRTLDKQQGGFNAINAAGAVKQDLVISAYKPNGGLEDRFRLEAGTEDGVWDFMRTHLKQLPVFVTKEGQGEVIAERQNYLLFDRMVAFHVQRGVTVPLSAAEFYQGLTQRFAERDGMYFLTDQVAEYDRKRMSFKEVLQLDLFVTDEASAIQWLKQQLTRRPQTFQEIHPQFLKEIAGWDKHEKSLELSSMLAENFLRFDGRGEVPSQVHSYLSSNWPELRKKAKDDPALKAKAKDRWYVPDPSKAGDLEKLRERALLREFAEYLPAGYKRVVVDDKQVQLPGMQTRDVKVPKGKKLKVIRLEAVRAGFKQCWQNRDYRTIIAVAQRIPENVLQEDPKLLMWYDQAVTRMGEE